MGRHVNRRMLQRVTDGQQEKAGVDWRTWLVASVALAAYANALACGLVFDDLPAIRDNKDLRPSTPLHHLLRDDFWGTPMHREWSHKSYRPLSVLSFRFNYAVHELQPFGYHLINVLLHGLVSLLYYRLCSDLLPCSSSFVAAMLFAVHPIHTEAVTGVVGRAELLCSVFYLLSFCAYRRSIGSDGKSDWKSLSQSVVFAALAMLSKEQGITVVAICATYDIFLVQKPSLPPGMPGRSPIGKVKGPTPTWRKDLVLRLLILAGCSTLLMVVRLRIMGATLPVFSRFDNPAANSDWPVKQLTYGFLPALNGWLLLFPWSLCCDWTMGTVPLVTSVADVRLAAAIMFYAVIGALLWQGFQSSDIRRRRTILAVCLSVFPFLPASNLLFPVGFVVAERVLYLPSLGFCWLVAEGYDRLRRIHRTFFQTCLVILMCLHTLKTVNRNFDWMSEESLFESGLKVTKSNAKLYNNLGHVTEAKKDHQRALALFQQAANVQPDDVGSHLNIGRTFNAMGKPEEAEQAFWRAKELFPRVRPGRTYRSHIVPRHMDLFLDLGNLLSRNTSRLEEAQQLYREAISMKTDYIDGYLQRASILLKLNRTEEAQDMYQEALKHDRMNPDIFYNLGVLLLEQGKSNQALARFDQALRLDPGHEKSLLNYAILSQDVGDSGLRRLANERLRSLVDRGQQPERTYFNLGMLAVQDGHRNEAERYFRKALTQRSDFGPALFNLALILHDSQRPLEAVPHLRKLMAVDEGHTKGILLLGNIYFEHLGNYTAAQECFELILRREPNHVAALHNLCAAQFQAGLLESAERCLVRASHLAPGEAFVKRHLDLVRRKRREEEARDSLAV